jgi:hypothetical protein
LKAKKQKPTLEDLKAVDKVIDLVKSFSDKNLINKRQLDAHRLRQKVNDLIDNIHTRNFNVNDFHKILRKLKSIIKKDVLPEIYYISGGHGGIIINDIGFCEFDSPQYAFNRLMERMEVAIATKMPYNLEIATCCLAWLKQHHPDLFTRFLKLHAKGLFEIINPSYSQPYNLIIGEESNIKQLEYGINTLKSLGLDCNIYYASEASIHPQLPQLLRSFDLRYCSLRMRLLGMSPTSPSGNIDFIGLDGTKVQAITDQSGIYNGELWHGTFYQELPNLLFQAVSRPFFNHLIYSSIEDFIMPLPYQEEVWRVNKYLDIFGKFICCSELFKLTKKDGEFQFNRDQFDLGQNIFLQSDLFLNNRECEACLIAAETLNCIIKVYGENSNEELLNSLWEKLLLTQAHDNYAVPFIRSGDYSMQQLTNQEYAQLKLNPNSTSISSLSMTLLKEIKNQCNALLDDMVGKLARKIITKPSLRNNKPNTLFIFNPSSYPRKDLYIFPYDIEGTNLNLIDGAGNFINFVNEGSNIKIVAEVPPLGYNTYYFVEFDEPQQKSIDVSYFYEISVSKDLKSIKFNHVGNKMFSLTFESQLNYKIMPIKQIRDSVEETFTFSGESENGSFFISITQCNEINRLSFSLESKSLKGIKIHPHFEVNESYINYPFGMEQTKRSSIQSLDFLILKGSLYTLYYMQKNSQSFKIERSDFSFKNIIKIDGHYEFSIIVEEGGTPSKAYEYRNNFLLKFVGTLVESKNRKLKKSKSTLSLNMPLPISLLWSRKDKNFIRFFNPTMQSQEINLSGDLIGEKILEVNLNNQKIRAWDPRSLLIASWEIKTFEI